jgi:hypothetical protein
MECPCCGKGCVKSAEDVLSSIDDMYMACPDCGPEPNMDKNMPHWALPDGVWRCRSCGRTPLDAVMRNVLHILVHSGFRDEGDTLRSIGSPLIGIGYPLAYPPRLGPQSLMIMGERLSKDGAEKIIRSVPEVKGVILSRGIAGIIDSEENPVENELLAGCDVRADIVQSIFGELVVYKSQSKIHIEFPRQSRPKMRILEAYHFAGSEVVDGLCGPGTLGLMCALAGAKRVILNDIWLPAIENVLLNLEVNRGLLGMDEIEYLEAPNASVGKEPVLVARAFGACEIEVYHGDLARLFSRARPADICLIDHFPGARTKDIEAACSCCKRVVIV